MGDAAYILENLTDDVDWSVESTSTVAPWFGRRKGKADVGKFFEALGSEMTVTGFDPVAFGSNDNDGVFTVVTCAATRNANGKSEQADIHHYFRLRDGKVAYWRGTEDTAPTAALFRDRRDRC